MRTGDRPGRLRSVLVGIGLVGAMALGAQAVPGTALADQTDPPAPVVTTTGDPVATVPDAPVASAVAGDHSATVTWSVPADGGSPLTGFTVAADPGGATMHAAATDTSAEVGGLTNGTAYRFTVTADSAVGSSDPSPATEAVVPFGQPNPPTGLRLTTADGSITASWSAAVPNGQAVSAYRVDVTTPGGDRSLTVPGDTLMGTVSGLGNGTAYSVVVTTVDATGATASGTAATATPGRAPGPPGSVRAAAGTSLVGGAQNALVTWLPSASGGTPVTGYVVSAAPGGQSVTVPAGATRATVPGIVVGRPTVFTVTATSSSGTSSASSPAFTLGVVDGYYATLGGPGSYLGAPTAPEAGIGSGRVRTYAGGSIYWSTATGPHAVRGAILGRYQQLGGPTGFVGFPTSDETAAGPGRRSTFNGANIYWSSSTGTHEVHGLIRACYVAFGDAASVLGLPTTDESPAADGVGRYNHFSGGSVYWSPASGAHEVQGAIRSLWSAGGWETGMVGYPTSNEYAVPGGRRSDFQFGYIVWTPAGGARRTVTRGDRIVAVARTHLGAPYVYGAAGPSTFDCSGLVQYVHRQLGMAIPRTTWLQAPASRPIAKSAAMPGDVIFLLDGSHEGIYVGNGQMIDAPHTGAVVTQRAIWTSSYSVGRFWG